MPAAMPPHHLRVMKQIHNALKDTSIVWALTGSTSFALQGMAVMPNDIDIQTDEAGAYAIAELFADYVVVPVSHSATETIRSHFGRLDIDGIIVEIMGGIEKRLPDGQWDTAPDIAAIRLTVDFDGMTLPVLSLEYEYQAYLKLGRIERAQHIRRFLDGD